MLKWIGLLIVSCFIFSACGEDESSICETGGACEQMMLNQCTCCEASRVQTCQTDKQNACATGQLEVSMSPETCAEQNGNWSQYISAGQNPCNQIDPTELNNYCTNNLMD